VVASVVFARALKSPLGKLLSAGVFALGTAFVGLALAPTLALACVAAFVAGAGNGVDWPSLLSLVQSLTPPNLHGRVMGALESLASLSLAIGLPLGGLLVAISDPRVAFLVIGVGTLATTAGFLKLTARETVPTLAAAAPDPQAPAGALVGMPELLSQEPTQK
jgi:predicted MFS family arabinose efflux permease